MSTPDSSYPAWLLELVQPGAVLESEEALMRVAIEISRQAPREVGGGPFGCVVATTVERRIIALGWNHVVPDRDASAHAEITAIRRAGRDLGTHRLRGDGVPAMTLYSSCAPCLMCTGAIHWAGVPRVRAAASCADAEALGFSEGTGDLDVGTFLESRGIDYDVGLLAADAVAALGEYDGAIYNG